MGSGSSGAGYLSNPTDVFVDAAGNVYVADQNNSRVQRFAVGSTSGSAGVTVAGGNGYGSNANQLSYPSSVYVDATGNVYVSDLYNNRVQKWAPGATSGTTVAGGNGGGSSANQLYYPMGIFVDALGNIYVADRYNYRVQKWAAGATSGTTVAGITGNGGSGANQLNGPVDVYVDALGNVYVADFYNYRVQKWAAGATSGTTVAGGNGNGSNANQLTYPTGVFVDANNSVYVVDQNNNRVQKWTQPVSNTYTPSSIGSFTATVTVNGCVSTTNALNINPLPTPSVFSHPTV